LHLYDIIAESVFSGQLVRLWEVIDFLIVAKPLILIMLQGLACPQDVPVVVALGLKEPIVLQNHTEQATICFDKLKKQIVMALV
jgi:ABC-type amino acid transport system permease subunit